MNKDIILKKGDIVTFEMDGKDEQFIIQYGDGKKLQDLGISYKSIKKIERPIKYETIYEVKEILNDKEKEYLSYVIRPFRDRVKIIRKNLHHNHKKNWIKIKLTPCEEIEFPFFEKDTMYKGMEIDKEYTLEELGL